MQQPGLPVYLSGTNPPPWEPLPLGYTQPRWRQDISVGRYHEGGEDSQTPVPSISISICICICICISITYQPQGSVASSVPLLHRFKKVVRRRKQPGKGWNLLLLELVSLTSWLERFECLSHAVGISVVADVRTQCPAVVLHAHHSSEGSHFF